MTKSPLTLARTALDRAKSSLPAYSSRFSRHDYTQHQLYALLAVRDFLRTDYRGLEATLHDWSDLREILGLSKVPDHTTLQRAASRLAREAKKPPITPDVPTLDPASASASAPGEQPDAAGPRWVQPDLFRTPTPD